MSDFNLNVDDLTDSKTVTSALKRSFYPDNKQVIQNTSHSQSGNYDRTLMSRDVVKVMQGDGLYRNPAFALAGYEQNTKSAMHTILAMGADVDNIEIPDPDDPQGEKLTGSQARMEIARRSVMSTGFAPGGFESSMQAFISSTISDPINEAPGSGASSSGSVPSGDGQSIPHSTKGYSTSDSTQVYNGGNRSIAIIDQLSEAEKDEYSSKAEALLKKSNLNIGMGDAGIIKSGFSLDFNKNSKNQDLASLNFDIKQSGSYIQVAGQSTLQWQTETISKDTLGTGVRRCMPSAALLELLNRLTDNLYISGGLGIGRGIIGPNFAELNGTNSISDHAFGRGFDIEAIGQSVNTRTSLVNPAPSPQVYLKTLSLLLQYIEALPQELHPDLIMISDQLSTQLGIVDGLESGTSAIRKMYPNISKSTNFGTDSSHRTHIHISFGSKRAGAILPAQSIAVSKSGVSDLGYNLAGDYTDKFKKQYKQGDGPLSDVDVFTLLNSYGSFGEEVAAIFTAIAYRESRYNPWSTNDSGFWGMWQLGSRTNSGGLISFEITVPNLERIAVWKLAYKDWDKENLTAATADNFIREKQQNDPTKNAGRQFFDPRAFIPLNQIYALKAKFGIKDKEKRIDSIGKDYRSSILAPWGEGYLYHGWLSKIRYSDASSAYTKVTGKPESTLRDWILKNIPQDSRSRNQDPITGKSTLESWLDGKVYSIIYQSSNGTYNAPDGWPEKPGPN